MMMPRYIIIAIIIIIIIMIGGELSVNCSGPTACAWPLCPHHPRCS